MDLYMQADTAWCFDERLWHFKGNVFIDNRATQTTFRTHEVFWDMLEHRFYSDSYMQIKKAGAHDRRQSLHRQRATDAV